MAANPIKEHERELRQAFSRFDQKGLLGLMSEALAGEYYGSATYAQFEADARDKDERAFWRAMWRVEQVTAESLELWFARKHCPLPDREMFVALGRRAAQVFAGKARQGYFGWVEPLINEALERFRFMQTLVEDDADRIAVTRLIDHESAIKLAWQLVATSFRSATERLLAFLQPSPV